MNKKVILILLIISMFFSNGCSNDQRTEENKDGLLFEDGMAQPILTFSNTDVNNEESEILRFCVYVETDHDTDADGKNDLVKVFMQIPRKAVEGSYKAATIYDPTPYPAGVTDNLIGDELFPYAEDDFDYNDLYRQAPKRVAEETIDTLSFAKQADPSEYRYSIPISGDSGYYNTHGYDYFLIRGFAIAICCGIGTYGSEGFELCGFDLERDSHKCVVEWLAGDRTAFIDKEGSKAIAADWSNGCVAMTGTSYGGTLPYEVATTGVEGLKTIIPIAGIANWYDYTNSQGINTYGEYAYTDLLSSYNSGGDYLDDNYRVIDPTYASFLKTLAEDEREAKGLFTDIWKRFNYSDAYEKINCPALIVHGLNDFNVRTLQAEYMYNAFKKANQNVKLLLHQDAHNYYYGKLINDELFDELMNKWLSHYLYDVDNGIENIPEIQVQSNIDGSFVCYDTYPSTSTVIKISENSGFSEISSASFENFYKDYVSGKLFIDRYYLEQDENMIKVFDIEVDDNSTIIGSPIVHLDIMVNDPEKDNMMLTAVLLDVKKDGGIFNAYMTGNLLNDILPTKTIDEYFIGENKGQGKIKQFVQSPTDVKAVTYGWTNLRTPDRGKSPAEYESAQDLQKGESYGYNIYLQPTVYTLAPGHIYKLAVLAQDPQRVLMDENESDATPYYRDDYVNPEYSFIIDNSSLEIEFEQIN